MNSENIKQWVQNEDKIQKLRQMLATLTKQQESLEAAIIGGISEEELSKVRAKLSTGGTIRFKQIDIQQNITQTFLLHSLKTFYQSSEAETVFRFILSQRVPKKKWIIKKYVQ